MEQLANWPEKALDILKILASPESLQNLVSLSKENLVTAVGVLYFCTTLGFLIVNMSTHDGLTYKKKSVLIGILTLLSAIALQGAWAFTNSTFANVFLYSRYLIGFSVIIGDICYVSLATLPFLSNVCHTLTGWGERPAKWFQSHDLDATEKTIHARFIMTLAIGAAVSPCFMLWSWNTLRDLAGSSTSRAAGVFVITMILAAPVLLVVTSFALMNVGKSRRERSSRS